MLVLESPSHAYLLLPKHLDTVRHRCDSHVSAEGHSQVVDAASCWYPDGFVLLKDLEVQHDFEHNLNDLDVHLHILFRQFIVKLKEATKEPESLQFLFVLEN